MQIRILLVETDPKARTAMASIVESLGYEAVMAQSASAAVDALHAGFCHVCVLGMDLPSTQSQQIMATISALEPATPAVALLHSPRVKDIVQAHRMGASDFLTFPFHPPMAAFVLDRAIHDRELPTLGIRTSGATLLGEHPAVNVILERIDQVADSNASVLITGEEGTGKETVARLIAACGERRDQPFVTVRLNPDLRATGDEIFGDPARQNLPGRLQEAAHGTLFLDSVASLPRDLQMTLARFLKDPGKRDAADVRIIASSTRPLAQAVREGTFLEDLFYRLNVIPIDIPPLRERPEDIPILVDHFRRAANARHHREVPPLPPEVLVRLSECDWPGNVRQLEHRVDNLVASARNQGITVHDLPANLRTDVNALGQSIVELPPYGVDLRLLLTQLEDRLIGQALERTGGNRLRAAELLGMNRTTLVEKLRRRNVA